MPNLSTIFFSSSLANMSSPGTSSFNGEFLILVRAFQRNSLVATLAALGMIFGAAYSLWLYNRAVSRNLKPDFLHKFSYPNGREVSIFIPFLVGGATSTRRFIINMMIGMETRSTTGVLVVQDNQTMNNSNVSMRLFGSTGEPDARGDGIWDGGLPLWLRVGAAIAYGYSNERAPTERKVRITSTPPAKQTAGAAGKFLARRPKISLVLDKYVELFEGPWMESQSIFSRIPYHDTHGDLSIDKSEGPPLNKFLKSNKNERVSMATATTTGASKCLDYKGTTESLFLGPVIGRCKPRKPLVLRGNALQSEVLRLREEMFLVDARLGTPRICMQDEPTRVPINRATRFENLVGFLDLVAGESLIKEQILERFFIDLVASESLIKERAAARVSGDRVDVVSRKLGFDGICRADPMGFSGGVAPGASACYLRIAPWISSEMFDASWGFFGNREVTG
ncbi:hypothetical protein HAX54_043452 [Datura stramonium]|uniref:NADH-ubiquinone oxidoreductase chain 4 n=1 Tax=Datura stramonium TaxID=4076 RepID=A0ABS8RPI9_DATST|nr:hypothetical protein [Datura stramonium]